jgi:protein TonB
MTPAVTAVDDHILQRTGRWSAGFLAALVFHGVVIGALLFSLAQNAPPDGGVIEMDLPPISMDATSPNPDVAEDANATANAPPPSDADDDKEETPPEPAEAKPEEIETAEMPIEEPVPTEPDAPEPVATEEEPPPVDEAPLAPDPEVTLPKPIERKRVEKPREPAEAKPRPARPKKTETAKETGKKSGPKSDSKAAARAAGGGGKFNPSAISRPHPPYPSAARASRTEGVVVVRYSVSPSGSVTSVSVVSASPPGVFNGVTVSAVRSWRFRPSASGGSGTTTIRFKLR